MRAPLFALLAAVSGCGASPPSPTTAATADRESATTPRPDGAARARAAAQTRLDEFIASTALPGISAAFVLPSGESVSIAAGLADIAREQPLTPDDRMLLGSVGKTFVAALTLQLAGDGLVDLDGPIARWLGQHEWFSRLPNAPELTLRRLLMHRTGIPRHIFTREFLAAVKAAPDRMWQPAELVSYILDAPPKTPPDGGFAYADTNYILVGMVLEQATGETYYDLLQRRILAPLGLAATAPSTARTLPRLATGYSSLAGLFGGAPTVNVGGETLDRVVTDGRYFINPQLEWTGGGLVTTPRDLARWTAALYGGAVLDEAAHAAMLAVEPSPELGGSYGLGVHVEQTRHGAALGHDGVMPGYTTAIRYFPDLRLAIAVQINTDARTLLEHPPAWYVLELADTLHAQSATPSQPAPEAYRRSSRSRKAE